MNKTIMQGKWRQTRGNLKAHWGEITDDDRRILDGKIDQMVGLIQERYGYKQEQATHALKDYLRGYGKHGRRHAASTTPPWRLAMTMIGMSTLIATGGFVLARLFAAQRETPPSEAAGQEPFDSLEEQFA